MPERRPDWLPVARWEISRILRRKDFIISVVATPILLFAFTFLSSMFEHKGDRKIAVVRVAAGGDVVARGPEALSPVRGFAWVDPGAAGADTAALASAVRARSFEAALVIRSRPEGAWAVDLVTRREPPRWTRELRDHLEKESRRARANDLGVSPTTLAALDDSVTVRSHVALGARSGSRRADFFLTFGVLMLMIAILMTSMSYIMVGISGEKQARVTEVVVSAIPAQAWMDGKIIAFLAIGMLTGIVWTASLLALAGPLAFSLPDSVNTANLALTALFASLGLYLYNALIAALMASAQNMQTASRWQANFLMLPFIPFFFLGGLIDNPDSTAMMVLSQIPLFSPLMMPTRMTLGAAHGWEIALALILLVAACVLMRTAAGRVFRLGMLMYGKDMTLSELVRWARVK